MEDLIFNLINTIVLLISGVILFYLSYKIYSKNEENYYFEVSFAIGFFTAALASLMGVIFRIPYLLPNSETLDIWFYGSLLYYVFMTLALSFILATGVAIQWDKGAFYLSFITLIGIIFILVGYFTPGYVTAELGAANVDMAIEGVVLIFGTISLLVLCCLLVFLNAYLRTKNYGTKMMFFGMCVIITGSFIGGLGDLLTGILSRVVDSSGYIFVLIGLILMNLGFGTREIEEKREV